MLAKVGMAATVVVMLKMSEQEKKQEMVAKVGMAATTVVLKRPVQVMRELKVTRLKVGKVVAVVKNNP